MLLSWFDAAVVLMYLLILVLIGLDLKKRAAKNFSTYLVGEKKVPWYMLGMSNASSMFDISGTMWLVSLTFVYGLKSIWIPWLWPVFNQIFLMVFLSVWLRRSNLLTGAEWIRFRFGQDQGANLSFFIVVIFAIVSVLGFIAYGFIGLGKFAEIFVPWSAIKEHIPFSLPPQHVTHFYGVVITLIATIYVMMGGMLGIVWADIIQFGIMAVAAISIGVVAMSSVSPGELASAVPEEWFSPLFSWELSLDWQLIIPEVNEKIRSDGYELFGIFFMLMLFKGCLVSFAGPAPNKDMQKILSTRSPKEAALMSGFVSVVLLPIRYILIAGIVVLALVYFNELGLLESERVDFEKILPAAILEFMPIGLLGLMVAAMLAAFVSTFASSVNAAVAYLVNDVYRQRMEPQASDTKLVRLSYAATVLVVMISLVIGLFIQDINSIMQWIVSGLWGGYVSSNVLKWYWWRLNGYGYFWGMLSGMVGAMLLPILPSGLFVNVSADILPLYLFPLLLVVSGCVSIFVSLSTPSVNPTTLTQFYRQTRPWGLWGPVKQKALEEDPNCKVNNDFFRDMFNVLTGIVFQTCLVLLPILVITKLYGYALLNGVLLLLSMLCLKRFWYDHLEEV